MHDPSEYKCGRTDDVTVVASDNLFLYNLGAKGSQVEL